MNNHQQQLAVNDFPNKMLTIELFYLEVCGAQLSYLIIRFGEPNQMPFLSNCH